LIRNGGGYIFFLAAQGPHLCLAAQGFFAAHEFLATHGFFAAHGCFAAQGFLALQGLQAAIWTGAWPLGAAMAAGKAPAMIATAAAELNINAVRLAVLVVFLDMI